MAKSSKCICINSTDANLPHAANEILRSEKDRVQNYAKNQIKKEKEVATLANTTTRKLRRSLRRKDLCFKIQIGMYGIGSVKHTENCRQRVEKVMASP